MTLLDTMRWEVDGDKLLQLETDSRDLKRAKALIRRLRVENRYLEHERAESRNRLVALYDKMKSLPHKYGVTMAAHVLSIPFGITAKTDARATGGVSDE